MTDEQIQHFSDLNEQSAARAADRAESRALKRATTGFLVLLAGLLIVSFLVGQAIQNSSEKTDADLRAAQISSCERVNILRAQSNISDVVQFQVLSSAAQREYRLAEIDTPNTRPTHKRSADEFASLANQLTVTPITDCPAAVDTPRTYKIPVAGPIGDPKTGEIKKQVESIRDSSERIAKQQAG